MSLFLCLPRMCILKHEYEDDERDKRDTVAAHLGRGDGTLGRTWRRQSEDVGADSWSAMSLKTGVRSSFDGVWVREGMEGRG